MLRIWPFCGRILAHTLCLFCLWAHSLLAGAWPRDTGTGFAALSYAQGPQDSYRSIYAEYGLGNDWTAVGDLGRGDDGALNAQFALSHPLGHWGTHRVAYQFGMGFGGDDTPRLIPALAWGRGFTGPIGNGWMTAEGSLQFTPELGLDVAKLDVTFGLSPAPRVKTYLQLQGYQSVDDLPLVRAEWILGRKFGTGTHVLLGISKGLRGPDDPAAKWALWFDF